MSDKRIIMRAPREMAVATALDKCAVAVDAVAPGRWAFTLSNGTDLAARARVDDGWLLLTAALGDGSVSPTRSWELLRWNAVLDGGARVVVRAGRPGLRACAELALDDEVDLPRRILEACAGLRAANERWVCAPDGAGDAMTRVASEGASADLPRLCRESGWSFVEREAGRLGVDLDVPGAFQQAIVEPRGRGVAVTVPVLEAAGPSPSVCEQALGLLLLRVCGIVRMARAAAEAQASQARFEVVFGSRPCAAELTHAFAALSVACRIAGREAAVLWSDEKIAEAYIEQWDRKEGGP